MIMLFIALYIICIIIIILYNYDNNNNSNFYILLFLHCLVSRSQKEMCHASIIMVIQIPHTKKLNYLI